MLKDFLEAHGTKLATALGGLALGTLAGYLTGKLLDELSGYPEKSQGEMTGNDLSYPEETGYTEVIAEPAPRDVPAKPDSIFAVKVEDSEGYLQEVGQDDALELETMHVLTYFAEDGILAGMDDSLEELEPAELGISPETMVKLESGSVSGMYLAGLEPGVGYEVVVSHDDYAEAVREAEKAAYEELAGGYSGE